MNTNQHDRHVEILDSVIRELHYPMNDFSKQVTYTAMQRAVEEMTSVYSDDTIRLLESELTTLRTSLEECRKYPSDRGGLLAVIKTQEEELVSLRTELERVRGYARH